MSEGIIGKKLNINNQEVEITNAETVPSEELMERKHKLTFKIQNLPFDVSISRIRSFLEGIGFVNIKSVWFEKESEGNFEWDSDTVIFNTTILERLKESQTKLASDHIFTDEGFDTKIRILCFGHCFKCGKQGHSSRECKDTSNKIKAKTCHCCGSVEHLIAACPSKQQAYKMKVRGTYGENYPELESTNKGPFES